MTAPLAQVAGEAAELPDTSALFSTTFDFVRISFLKSGFVPLCPCNPCRSASGSRAAVEVAVREPALISVCAESFLAKPVHAL